MEDVQEVRCFRTKDGEIFPDGVKAKGHAQQLEIQEMKPEFVKYAEKLLDDLLDKEDGDSYLFDSHDYSNDIMCFEDTNIDEIVQAAMDISTLWDGRLLKLIKHIEREIKK